VDNQHKLIAGYRDLTQGEIDLINEWKQIELLLDTQLNQLEVRHTAQGRWNAMARTHLETGVMYAIKALACPQGGLGNPERQPPVQPYPQEYPPLGPDGQPAAQEGAPPEELLDEAAAKDRERRVHEDRQRHGFDPYAAKAQKARPAEEDEAAAIEREEIARDLADEDAAEELRSIQAEEEGRH
jgi:hypothetical protein